jgi:hypothetical protein
MVKRRYEKAAYWALMLNNKAAFVLSCNETDER